MKLFNSEVFASAAALTEVDNQALAAVLIDIAHHLCVVAPQACPEQDAAACLVGHAEEELRRRRLRRRHLPRDMSEDGVWMMLLELFVHHHRGAKVSTKAACIAADAPERTALRWLEEVEDAGLVERSPCAGDRRVRYVSLTDEGLAAVWAILSGYDN